MSYDDDSAPVELPRNLVGCLSGCTEERPYTGAPLDLPPSRPTPKPTAAEFGMMVERHLLGDAEYTTTELTDIGRSRISEYRRHIARLTMLAKQRDGD